MNNPGERLNESELEAFFPMAAGPDAFDELLQTWLQEEDPAAPWHEGGGPLPNAVGLEQAGPSTSPEPATSTALSRPLGMSDLDLEATAGALRPGSAPALSQRMQTRSRMRFIDDPGASGTSLSQQPEASGSGTAQFIEASDSESGDFLDRAATKAKTLAKRSVSAVTKPVSALMGEIRGGVKRTFKRSKTAEERAERIKDRNRRAQKAFRDRQKALSMERTVSYQLLEADLDRANEERAELMARIKALEAKLDQDTTAGIALGVDACPLLLTVDEENPVEYAADDLRSMEMWTLVPLYRAYVDSFRQLLPEWELLEAGPAYERIVMLLEELSALATSLVALNIGLCIRFQPSNLAGEEEEQLQPQPPEGHWARVLDAMRLTDEQVAGLLKCRQEHLTKLSPIVKERWQIYRSQLASFRPILEEEPSSSDLNLNYRQAQDAVQALSRNLREEQALRLASLSIQQQRFFTIKQKAVKIVESWPYYPDSLEMGNVLARLHGAPTARELLGIDSMPPADLPF